ncbi:MAG: aminotransferase class III-fold pyridoxal phosphate-dependent enzyme, partial [Sphingopyxis sp.]
GRTGSFLACEQADVTPDILCLSKGITGGSLPLAATLATAPIFDAHYSTDRSRQFFHSSSYTANPIACAAANANLAIWRDEPVLDRITTLAQRQAHGLARLANVPGLVNPRQMGTIIAIDVQVRDGAGYLSAIGPQLLAFFREHNVLLRPLGNSVYVMPPYCIEPADLALIYDAIAAAATMVQQA